ncbi:MULTISPECIES: AcrZ family multidrug efflux pump-associated protein [Erwinia]|uniref:Multidrug efflux pump accessory protein AcrZ n=1 Tax=Erwinia pyrifoliae TaxID=79967 RepID=A0ABY5X4L9_ERWPY|nr:MULTISPECIES: AcrZ family multidrug efflux pump-associated protein [Erwinia]ADP12001.1 Putative outer membrane or exported [Erwinia sp. Ejp617]AUX72146.1 multidrug efflux pump-associated protein, AcrZ family [Erwinia pyrifoliae]MCA8877613.1 multidrug efflux pump-associated protein, AcrZ family [Erwinia pyrifoliae]MCT2388397.1 AcrZ family multidrug efflux pump-associated protein [Erwinia pyrifoliae]MCU8586567.1 AcrZ family multidrug efflux pump-associated protein [Erwinia pyrifoliae]
MLELLKGLAVAVLMVPVVMAIILGLIWGLGEVFNVISKLGHRDGSSANKSHSAR